MSIPTASPGSAHRIWVPLAGLAAIIIGRVLLQIALYRSGFTAFTADDFGRAFTIARWVAQPTWIWSGPWMPFYTYLLGAALWLHNNILWTPRIVATIFGLSSLILTYALSMRLSDNRPTALVATFLLAINPIHVRLSAVPLTEIFHTTLVLGSMLAFLGYLRERNLRDLLVSALVLAAATGFRFEAWMVSVVYSLAIAVIFLLRLRQNDAARHELAALAAAAVAPWLFPLAWMAGNYATTGNPLDFLVFIYNYKATVYGGVPSYGYYLEPLRQIDPYVFLLILPLTGYLLWHRRSPAMIWFVAITLLPTVIFFILHGGQLEPIGNFVRYLAPFVFMIYPLMAIGLVDAAGWIGRSERGSHLIAMALCAVIGATQLTAVFDYENDPAAPGLAVGQALGALRTADPDRSEQPALIELRRWQYLAIHVGANDPTMIWYDRPGTEPEAESLLAADPLTLQNCMEAYRIGYLAVHSAPLRTNVEQYLGYGPIDTINGYALYELPLSDNPGNPADCPVAPGRP
jgi:hypothetical protein